VINNQPADLTELPESDRHLSGSFLGSLLFGTSKTPISEIVIIGAMIDGPIAPPSFFLDSASARTVPSSVTLYRCVFSEKVSLDGVQFGNGLDLAYSHFLGGLNLSNIHVEGSVKMFGIEVQDTKGTLFPIILTGASISGDLSIGVPVAARIDATDLTAKTFSIIVPPTGLDELSLSGISVAGFLDIESAHSGARNAGTDSIIRKKIDLSSASVGLFKVSLPRCPGNENEESLCWPAKIYARGFVFHAIAVEEHSDKSTASHIQADLNLEFLNKANFSESAFTAYEQLLRTGGRVTDADSVYAAMHMKLRSDLWQSSAGQGIMRLIPAFHNVLDFSQNLFLGYGRSAIPPLLWSLSLIIVGARVFRKQELMETHGKEASPSFSALWYSLELFLPVVDLGLAKHWRPRRTNSVLVGYWRAHQLAGWILIPVALAAITGALK
jgi:hypothetical protein